MRKQAFAVLLSMVFLLMGTLVKAQSFTRSDQGTSNGGYVTLSLTASVIRSGQIGATNVDLGTHSFLNNDPLYYYPTPFGTVLGYTFRIGIGSTVIEAPAVLPGVNDNAVAYTYVGPGNAYGIILLVACDAPGHYIISCSRTPPPL